MSYVIYKGQKHYIRTNLILRDHGIKDIFEIKGLENLTNLRELALVDNQITEIKGLEHFTNLQVLNLSRNQITEIKGLEYLTNLQVLILSRNQITEIKGLEHLTNLKILSLSRNQITEVKGLENLTNLEHLTLHKNPIKNEQYFLLGKSAQEVVIYCKENRKETKMKGDFISKNKKTIHKLIYNEKLSRCTLFSKTIKAKCNCIEEIKQIIEQPRINGFFMYKFPSTEEQLSTDERQYKDEIMKIKELITKVNEDPFIEIHLPREVTGNDAKTCEFCKFARSYDFGILLMSPPNANAYLEAGLFISLGKKVILLRNGTRTPKAPFDLDSFIEIYYKTIEEMENKWNRKFLDFCNKIKKLYLNFDDTSITEPNSATSENLIKFYKMLSHEIEFTKGELIYLVKQIGNDNFNKYLNMELKEEKSWFELSHDGWHLFMYKPDVPKISFEIHGVPERDFINYIKNSLIKSLGNIEDLL